MTLNSLWFSMNIKTNINRKHFAKLQVASQKSTANADYLWTYWIFDECRIIYLFEHKSSWLNHFYGPRRILWLVRHGLPCQQYRFLTGLFNKLDIGIGWIRSICISFTDKHLKLPHNVQISVPLYNGWCRQSLHKLIRHSWAARIKDLKKKDELSNWSILSARLSKIPSGFSQ